MGSNRAPNFSELVASVPALMNCLVSALSPEEHVRTREHITTLRMVDKLTSRSVLQSVTTLSIEFGGSRQLSNADLRGLVQLLRCTRLKRLKVAFKFSISKSMAVEQGSIGDHGTLKHSDFQFETNLLLMQARLAGLIASLRAAIGTVTTLEVTAFYLTYDRDGVERWRIVPMSGFLSLLAQACPLLQHLILHGHVQVNGLQAVGLACKALTRLDIEAHSLQATTLQQLHVLLPHVRLLNFHDGETAWHGGHESEVYTYAAIRSLADNTTLTHIDIGERSIDEATWAFMPPSLRVLLCDCHSKGPAVGVQLPCLEHVNLWQGDIQDIANLLAAAPKLRILDCLIHVPCNSSSLPLWKLICNKVVDGLQGVKWVYLKESAEGSFSGFLSAAQPMPRIRNVEVKAVEYSRDEDCLRNLGRVFPDMECLTLEKLCVDDESLHALLPCQSMTHLTMHLCDRVRGPGVVMLGSRLPAMEFMRFHKCLGVDAYVGGTLDRLLQLYGSKVRVLGHYEEVWF